MIYSKTCVRQPPLKLTLVVYVERWLSYKGTCHVILLANLHDMYLYKTDNFFHINHYLKSISKVALLHRFYCIYMYLGGNILSAKTNPPCKMAANLSSVYIYINTSVKFFCSSFTFSCIYGLSL